MTALRRLRPRKRKKRIASGGHPCTLRTTEGVYQLFRMKPHQYPLWRLGQDLHPIFQVLNSVRDFLRTKESHHESEGRRDFNYQGDDIAI